MRGHSLDDLSPTTPTSPTPDTAARSLAHWSEAGRDEMRAFYALAHLDYERLVAVADWPAALRASRPATAPGADDAPLALLDVACGSGRFPATMLRDADLDSLAPAEVAYDLLDPAPFSLEEAAGHLAPPFVEGARHATTLEDLPADRGPWDVVWATHALYALEPARLAEAAERFVAAIAPGGTGFLAQGAHDGHYLAVYRAFLAGMRGGTGTPYVSGEQIAAALTTAAAARGLRATQRRIAYEHVVADDRPQLLEGYLRRCLFDEGPTLAEMRAAPVLGAYLASCHDAEAGVSRFRQHVLCLALTPNGRAFPWTHAS